MGVISAEIYVVGDTIIEGQNYKKVRGGSEGFEIPTELVGFTREDTNLGRLWFRRISDTTERLIMDLSLEVGDVFPIYDEYLSCSNTQQAIVHSIDTMNGRKIINFDCLFGGGLIRDTLTFIEGIGSNASIYFQTIDLNIGLDNPEIIFSGFAYTMCRMLKNDTIFYPEGGSELCDFFSPVVEINESIKINIFPNPTTSTISIEPFGQVKSVHLHNISGVELLSQKKNFDQVDIRHFPKGLYFLSIEMNSGEILVKKIVKE